MSSANELRASGHVDPGESDVETAFRETEEESGYSKTDLRVCEDFIKTIKYNVRGKPKTTVYLLAELVKADTPVKLSEEHQAYEWAQLDRACALVQHETLQEVLRDCDTYLQKNSLKKPADIKSTIMNKIGSPKRKTGRPKDSEPQADVQIRC